MNKLLLALVLLLPSYVYAQQLETVKVSGKDRTMMVYAPAKLTTDRPLVISLHGANQDAAYQRDQTKWNNCADTANFVVVYPNAINKFWDTSGQSDIVFISSIIDMMYDRYQINRNRVYVTGFSLGSMMTYQCMEYMADKVAAFGPVSGVRFDNRAPKSTRRVPFIHTHGTGDDVFKWVGDPGHMAGGYPYIPDYVESWATYEGLTEKEVISPYPSTKTNSNATLTVWRSPDADDNIEVALLALKDKGHWHSEDLAAGVSTTQEIWRFCKRYSLQPEPPTVVSVVPEDQSFDLTDTDRSFTVTLTDNTDITGIKAELTCGETVVPLVVAETVDTKVLSFSVPDDITLTDGVYTLAVTGITNPEGGKQSSAAFTYYYGASEAGEVIKAGFKALYDHAVEIYELSDGASVLSAINARNRLKKYIDKYVDFASTSPSEYAKASANLQKNVEILEDYLQTVGITAISADNVQDVEYYSMEGVRLDSPRQGVNIVVRHSSGKTLVSKIIK